MINKEGKHWVLRSRDGSKILGTHPTKEKAIDQEVAIRYSQIKEGKKK